MTLSDIGDNLQAIGIMAVVFIPWGVGLFYVLTTDPEDDE